MFLFCFHRGLKTNGFHSLEQKVTFFVNFPLLVTSPSPAEYAPGLITNICPLLGNSRDDADLRPGAVRDRVEQLQPHILQVSALQAPTQGNICITTSQDGNMKNQLLLCVFAYHRIKCLHFQYIFGVKS